MAWYDIFTRKSEEENALTKSVEPLDITPNGEHVLETLAKEAKYHNIDPYDHANAMMMNSYEGSGKKYYFEEAQTDKLNVQALQNLSKHHIVSSIIGSRINQCAEFAQYSPDEDLGYKIVLKDEHEELTDDDRENIKAINRFLQQCGSSIEDYELTFESFIRQIIRDSLIYDQACFEIVKNRKGQISRFMPVDATTIKKAPLTKEEVARGRRDADGIKYVQVINNKVVAEYKQDELCFGVRRPRSEIKSKGYGYSELFELYGVLNNLFNAETYNAANFTNGINANGIIAIKSKMNPKLFRSFRREFYQMLNGVGNAKRTPLIQLDPDEKEDISSINLQPSNREMEYDTWVNYLIKITCSVYQIDPAEIGFVFGNESQNSSLFGTDPSARVLMGKEKGLRPLVRSLQSWINRYIIDQIDDRYKLVFTGLDSVSLMDKMKLEQHKMTYMTLNEIRTYHDLPELEDGDILASAYTAIKTAVIKEHGILAAEEVGKDEIDSELEEVINEEHEKELELDGQEIQTPSEEVIKAEFSDKEVEAEMKEVKDLTFNLDYLDDINWDDFSDDDAIFEVPPEVVAVAKEYYRLKEEFGDEVQGGTAVGKKRVSQLANGEKLSLNIIERMYSFLIRHKKNAKPSNEDKPWTDRGYISYMLWGGFEALAWVEELLYEVDRRTSEDMEKAKVDFDGDGQGHPAQYFEGLPEDIAREREKEIERRQEHFKETGEQIYGPLPGDDYDFEKQKQNKGTKSKKADEVREEIKKPGKDEFIRAASKVSGVKRSIIEEVYDKGLAAAATSGHRPGQTPQSWARARVYAFLFDSKSGARKADKALWDEHLESKKSLSVKETKEAFVEGLKTNG